MLCLLSSQPSGRFTTVVDACNVAYFGQNIKGGHLQVLQVRLERPRRDGKNYQNCFCPNISVSRLTPPCISLATRNQTVMVAPLCKRGAIVSLIRIPHTKASQTTRPSQIVHRSHLPKPRTVKNKGYYRHSLEKCTGERVTTSSPLPPPSGRPHSDSGPPCVSRFCRIRWME